MRTLRVGILATAIWLGVWTAPALGVVTPGAAGETQVFLTSDAAADVMALRCEDGQTKYLAISIRPCAGVEAIFVDGGAGADTIDLSAITRADFPELRRVVIDGGDFNDIDVIRGTQLDDTINENFPFGNDIIFGNDGDDQIFGGGNVDAGPGDDVVESPPPNTQGGPGDDLFMGFAEGLDGGPGDDSVDFDFDPNGVAPPTPFDLVLRDTSIFVQASGPPPVSQTVNHSSIENFTFRLLDGPQRFDASAFSGDVELHGRGGDDVLIGGAGEDFLFGGPGNDTLVGGPGFDYVDGGAGNDSLMLRDGEVDRALCGDGADTVVADRGDALDACETVDLPPAPAPQVVTVPGPSVPGPPLPAPPAADVTVPRLVVAGARLSGRRLTFRVTCPATEVRCVGLATISASGRRGARTRRLALGVLTVNAAGGRSVTLTRRLTAGQARTLRGLRNRSLAVALDVIDAAGNQARQRVTPRLG